MKRECNRHGIVDHVSRIKHGRKSGYSCIKCRSEAVVRSKRKRKAKAVAYKGGKCERCGYNKCQDALDFHHITGDKKFDVSHGGYRVTFEELKKELDKCIILCANCHREEHYNIYIQNMEAFS